MADALCGPSNPLQNLQKHSQADRTLQQDRLVGLRQSPGQGFRTADPRAGSLDAEFHAFENAAPSPFQLQQPEFSAPQQPVFHPQASGAAPGWAADFKRLSLNNSPVPAGQFRTEAPLVRSAPGGWQNEFMRQRSGAGTPVAQGKQVVRDLPPQQMMNMNTNTSMFASQSSMMNYSQPMYQGTGAYGASSMAGLGQQQYTQTSMTIEEQYAEGQMSHEDYEAAFAEAVAHAQEMDQQQLPQQEETAQSLEQLAEMNQTELPRIGSDAINYREQVERTADQDTRDADELARTAGLLLNSVQHDMSTKFQNSQFLDLMRRIRDREVKVQDNDLQTVGQGQGQGQGQASTSTMSTSQSQPTTAEAFSSMDGQNRQQQTSQFQFPDMDNVYAPDSNTQMTDDEALDSNLTAAAAARFRSPYTTYGFEDDQYPAMQPQNQMDALHPGGKWYPDQSPRLQRVEMETEMSGAIPSGQADGDDGAGLERMISASDFDYLDESAGLSRRFVRGGETGA
ncbi:hypothetical protein A1O1_01305 [Capronia coronata CBS 617.96]|uniref:Peroxin 20 n=1 Tax=Capronia coronata CBS 617.96 TaxID=1182541 RepID=W9ZNV7_9EURO|nr:uncharacterized protein A1O1_01305 [Capronia coronata CBS 617.96]EXJ96179.1 hypothetical protein A1O1_01305 [Capronia coronata CBS 617.96]